MVIGSVCLLNLGRMFRICIESFRFVVMFTIECGVVDEICRSSPISFKHMLFPGCVFCILTITTHESSVGVPLRKGKNDGITFACLRVRFLLGCKTKES